MSRWLYIRLLWAHPAGFRQRFGDEMLEAFDLAAGRRERLRILADGWVSLARQWFLRREFRQPASAPLSAGDLAFHQFEPYKPRGAALTQGGLTALLLIFGVVYAINHGGGKPGVLPIGMQRPGAGFIPVDRTQMEGQPLVKAEPGTEEDPVRAFARSYFRIVHVLAALDADGDLTISLAEVAGAPEALRRLDRNHDGRLSAEECGFLPPGDFKGSAGELAADRRDFMRSDPVLAALDADHDGEISAAEMANAPDRLYALDLDHTGTLSLYEVLPHPAVSHAASIVGRFDTNDSGLISAQGLPKDDPDAAYMRALLVAADRNHDGVVTRGELVVEFASRREMRRLREGIGQSTMGRR